jgi:hypothetical protein
MSRHSLFRELAGTLGVLWGTDARCIVIDRTSEAAGHVMAFKIGWNEIMEELENGLGLERHVLA